jgi:hypothetical protein
MRQQKQNKAVHHKKRRPPSNRRREKGKKRTARRLFHRVTANSLAACQDETPTAKEKRGGRDFLFSQDDVTASPNYMLENVSPLCVCSEIYPAGAAQQENWMLPSSKPEFSSFSLPSGVSSAAENRMKTSAFLFTSIVSLRHSLV